MCALKLFLISSSINLNLFTKDILVLMANLNRRKVHLTRKLHKPKCSRIEFTGFLVSFEKTFDSSRFDSSVVYLTSIFQTLYLI